jgi:hypothetical protein
MRIVFSRAGRVAAALVILVTLSFDVTAAERNVFRSVRSAFQRATQWAVAALARLGRPPGEPAESKVEPDTTGAPSTLQPPLQQ